MSTTDHKSPAGDPAPLGDQMLTMDVVDTLWHAPELARAADAVAQLKQIYARLGLGLSDAVAADGIAAFQADRFAYAPPRRGLPAELARAYVARRGWLPGLVAVALALIIGLGGYFLVYRPYRESQTELARVELAETMPAQMDTLYSTIFDETKVQQAVSEAGELRVRGKDAAKAGDRAGAEAAIADLTALRDTLRQDYRLTIVDRPGMQWGFWSFPEDNAAETNYYLVVEARGPDGQPVALPIRNEQTGRTETVSVYGLRVPEDVYRAVEADKRDDGTIARSLVGLKQFGFLTPDYLVSVLGGTVTRW